jgi:beta-glucanase (GH16 family)
MMQRLKTLAVVSLASTALAACTSLDQDAQPSVNAETTAQPASSAPDEGATRPAFFVDWTERAIDSRWYVSNHDMKNGQWESDWRSKNVVALPNGLNLKMTSKAPVNGTWPWAGAEIQYRERLGFGEYQMIVRAAEGSGLTSGFFTYTGPYYGTETNEIDVKFVGKSPNEVHFNAHSGNLNAGLMKYPLDFDTTKNFALYSFIWTPDRITWYVNGEFAHEVTADNFNIPQEPSILFTNVYQARNKELVGEPNFQNGATASYRCMSYRPLDDSSSRTCADVYDSYITGE